MLGKTRGFERRTGRSRFERSANGISSELSIDPNEIAEARWFTRTDVRLMLERRHPDGLTVPGKQAIANALIGSFVDAD